MGYCSNILSVSVAVSIGDGRNAVILSPVVLGVSLYQIGYPSLYLLHSFLVVLASISEIIIRC